MTKERADFILKCQRFIQAMFEAGESAAHVKRLRDEYEGTSFDYFHHGEIKDAEQAAERAGEILAELIDERIQKTDPVKSYEDLAMNLRLRP